MEVEVEGEGFSSSEVNNFTRTPHTCFGKEDSMGLSDVKS